MQHHIQAAERGADMKTFSHLLFSELKAFAKSFLFPCFEHEFRGLPYPAV